MLTIAAEEVAYKLQPVAPDTSTSSDHAIPEAPPSSPGNPPPSFWMPNLHLRPLHVIVLSIQKQPDPAGHRLMPPGGMWIYPRGSFREPPSSGCTTTWRTSKPSIIGWSTSLGEPTQH